MKHIDQKILELYVLRDENALQQHEMIEQHLAECAGCRELYARMQDLYAGFFDTIEKSNEQKSDSLLPMKAKKSLTILNSPSPLQEIRSNYEVERAPIRRVVLFAKRHPIVSLTMSLFMLGFFWLLGLQVFRVLEPVNDNPNYHRYTRDDKLEIYNSQNHLLWSIPGKNLAGLISDEQLGRGNQIVFEDIDGDGTNEVITTLILGSEKSTSKTIKVFNNKGKVVKSIEFKDKNFKFRNLSYDRTFTADNIFAYRDIKNQLRIVTIANNGRSPTFLVKLDSNFNIIGQYWHFGHLEHKLILLNNKKVILLTGKNDVYDVSMGDYAVMAILDPEKLIGVEESAVSQGFGFKKSESEMYYIKFPESDIVKFTNLISSAKQVVYEDSSVIYIDVYSGKKEDRVTYSGFNYVFNKRDMSVKMVKFNTGTERTHKQLKEEGKIHSMFNQQYLNNLKNNVQYWDGEKWVNDVVLMNAYKSEK
ncbi:MAG: hypothetical protein Q8L88_01455 [Bacteroidota bacterium]|nr:hypothetical protein [Bacteroidota bacterium]